MELVETFVTARFNTYEFCNLDEYWTTYVNEFCIGVDFKRHNRFELVPLLLFANDLFPDRVNRKIFRLVPVEVDFRECLHPSVKLLHKPVGCVKHRHLKARQ